MSNLELEKLGARLKAVEVALAYSLTNLSASNSDIKPAVISALQRDAKGNKGEHEHLAVALDNLAELIQRFKVQ
ncbi:MULTISPECIES: hypothetical protein [Yersinia]|nr:MULTISPECIES: hypothetical protein [Yersinia]CNL27041.1 Uncharacterised protein [Yersinia frederiksenii]